jgi:TonB family protein
MTFVLAGAARVTVVIALALGVAALMRTRSAAVRHWILALGVVAAMSMPALQVVAPQWGMPRPGIRALVGGTGTLAPPAVQQWASKTPATTITVAQEPWPAARIAIWVWIAGVIIGLGLLGAGFLRLAWIASRCEPVFDRRWATSCRVIAAQLGVQRDVAILQSAHDRVLVTWGLWTPQIILPAGACDWTDDRIRIVLCHELSHVRRGDWLLHVLAGVLRAIYWFNPVVWMAFRGLRHESERACDDEVLNLGMTGSDYATELLNIARTLRPPAWSPAPGMARPSSLQRRVRAMLNTNIDRSPLSAAVRVAIAAAALSVAIVVAGSGAAAQAVGAAISGSFVDALNNAIPNVTMTLKHNQTGEQYTVRSDSDGHFTFEALPDGDYQGEVNAPGFTSIHPFFRIKDGQSTQPTVIPLPLGSVEETITVRSVPPAASAPPAARNEQARVQAFRQRDPNVQVLPPVKLRDVRPIYPPNRTDEDATIFLEGVIDTNGLMKGVQVLQPANGDFGRAALDAVNGWQFEPTRLHGVPVDTAIHVTVRFVH